MILNIYKGFEQTFLDSLKEKNLILSKISNDVFTWDVKKIYKEIDKKLTQEVETNSTYWIPYECFSVPGVKERVFLLSEYNDLKVNIIVNNIYPNYFPLNFSLSDSDYVEIQNTFNEDKEIRNEKALKFSTIYSDIIKINGKFFVSYYGYEQDLQNKNIKVSNYFKNCEKLKSSTSKPEFSLLINGDVYDYLNNLDIILSQKYKIVAVRYLPAFSSKEMFKSFSTFCYEHKIKIVEYSENLVAESKLSNELKEIAEKTLNMSNFKFRNIECYKEPDINDETVSVSQAQIMSDIIEQSESAINSQGKNFRDIFITAPTGSGKSVLFQIPAIYLGNKHKKLTIVIEPIIALMEDQKSVLNARGYKRIEVINSNIISPVEKQKVIDRVKNGEVDILYLSPETLLSYTIDQIIGDRDIGLLVIDEAHIVTSWGQNFRPDYWYLGAYINKLRRKIQTSWNKNRKIHCFPICSFTATAINGGFDDSINETMISLNMRDPIKYIGRIVRDDIKFNIEIKSKEKLNKDEYEPLKVQDMTEKVNKWRDEHLKTIVYFPYVSMATRAKHGSDFFQESGFAEAEDIGLYVGSNKDESLTNEEFINMKANVLNKFRTGEISTVFATKAFGMGVDIDDINNVYHYAVSGSLSDYVQEIGRAARKSGLIGTAYTDFYENDMSFVQKLYGMSQIRQYQIDEVISIIYDTWKNKQNKKNNRSFLMSPESLMHIFTTSSKKDLDDVIGKIKTCLLMIEKDMNNKYLYNVIITRPRTIFTKSFIAVKEADVEKVIHSKYSKYFEQISKRFSDVMQCRVVIFKVSLDKMWEELYPNISFAMFKFYYFKAKKISIEMPTGTNEKFDQKRIDIMPEIINYVYIQQKIDIKTKNNLKLCDLKSQLWVDLQFISETLNSQFYQKYFTLEELEKALSSKYSKVRSKVIAHTILSFANPDNKSITHRQEGNKIKYFIKNHTAINELMKIVNCSGLLRRLEENTNEQYSDYMTFEQYGYDADVLKILAMFNYINYSVAGGEQPEIFIRLNSPYKFQSIVEKKIKYSNDFVLKATEKHQRDVDIMRKFFCVLKTDKQRWKYIEDYFLGKDVLK